MFETATPHSTSRGTVDAQRRDVDKRASSQKRIWIDLDNSPHVPFFAPIIEELERHGYSVVLTARDCFQVCELADLFHFNYRKVGRHYGKHKVWKALGTCLRALQLLPQARRDRLAMAVSHGSRAQLISAKLLGIPAVVICDYEFAASVPGASPSCVIVPEVIPDASVHFKGQHMLKYPGIKEDVYVPRFQPDAAALSGMGLDGHLVVTLRPPADEAHYRNRESDELLDATLELLSRSIGTKTILLPRNERQAAALRKKCKDALSSGAMMIPSHALDGLNLMWFSDLVISGGGTMNREAAALGVPVYSIFRGATGAVDRYLVSTGRLVMLQSVEEVRTKLVIKRRDRPMYPAADPKGALKEIVKHLLAIVNADSAMGKGRK